MILLQELFATPISASPNGLNISTLRRPLRASADCAFCRSCARAGVVLPVSFFERAGQAFFNSVAMVDADGRVLGVYRKSHIPQGPGYEEKFYFSPGDTGFRVWETAAGRVGVGICWDQWFPESARSMALLGAEVLLYPTAIGSEPPNPAYDSQPHWEMTQRGHAAANVMPLVASNRIGREVAPEGRDVTFYGSSFIAGPSGDLLAKASRDGEEVLTATVDLDEIAALRRSWGVFRDRRPDLYTPLRGWTGSAHKRCGSPDQRHQHRLVDQVNRQRMPPRPA
ncbi:nitrilase-related carbon-nitrogen hydrolase [Gemmobacter lanyuensis]